MRVTNDPSADEFLTRVPREGWTTDRRAAL
jgi:hypothetical protein